MPESSIKSVIFFAHSKISITFASLF